MYAAAYTTQLRFVVYAATYTTQLRFVVYEQIHNSASLRGVSSVKYTPRLRLGCVFLRTPLQAVGEYYNNYNVSHFRRDSRKT